MNAYEIDLTNNSWCVKEVIRNTVVVSVGDKVLKIVGALKISCGTVLLWDCYGVHYMFNICKSSGVSDLISLEDGLGKRIFY